MKGVSPVVATVLMVAVAIAAAVVAYSWFMSMQASVQAEASRGAGTVGKERLVVEAIHCVDGDHDLNVFVRNIGDEAVDGNFTFVVKDAATSKVLDTITSVYGNISPGSVKEFNLNNVNHISGCKTSSGSEYVIVEVMAPGGAVASKQERIGS